MKIKLFYIFILFLHCVNAYCTCEDIAENIGMCKKYECLQLVEGGNYIKHKIVGLTDKNLCLYVETQNNGDMVCYHSRYGIMVEKQYFENIFKQTTHDLMDIVRVRMKECLFPNNSKPNYIDQDRFVVEIVDSDKVLSQYDDIKSIFFDEGQVNEIIKGMKKFNAISETTITEQTVDNFNDSIVRLDAIIYFSDNIWKIWVNGKLFKNTKDLKVQSVTANRVVFVWNIDQKIIEGIPNDSQNISINNHSIRFILYTKQEFDLKNLSIR